MTLHISDAELLVYHPGNTSTATADADATIPASDLAVEITERHQAAVDQAQITVDNDNGAYTSDVGIGDRVRFRTQFPGEASLSDRWTGLVRRPGFTITGPTSNRLLLECTDFVFGVLQNRKVTNAFKDRQVAGTSSSIVNTIVSNNASEIGLSQVGTISSTRTIQYQRTNLLEALDRLLTQTPFSMFADGKDLVVEEKSALSAKWQWASSDRIGRWSYQESDENLANSVLIDGVRDTALDIEQTSYDSTETVTDSNRRTQQVDVRKGEVASIELRIQEDSNSSDNVIVRLQADDGNGNPKDAASFNSDLARTELPPSAFSSGWVLFRLPENNLPDPNPHILVEADGSTGHDVEYDSGTNELAYRVNYYYPVVIGAKSQDSIDNYRRYDGRYRRESVRGKDEGEQILKQIVARSREPAGTIEFNADSSRAHDLSTGDVVSVSEPDVGASGEFVVSSLTDSFEEMTLQTSITAKTKEQV